MSVQRPEFEHILDTFHQDLTSLRTQRATPSIVDKVYVNAYGSQMAIRELASISVPEPQLLVIEPWDKSILPALESALRESELDLQPVVDGERVRLPFPPLTEEKRVQLVKVLHEKAESARVRLRKLREEELKSLKQQQKNGDMSEDEYFSAEKEMQKTMDHYNAQIKTASDKKEAELMTV